MIANMFVKFDVVKIFRKTTFARKCFCFDFCYANFFEKFLLDLLLLFYQTNLLNFLLLFLLHIFFHNLHINIVSMLLFCNLMSLFDLNFANLLNLQKSFTT